MICNKRAFLCLLGAAGSLAVVASWSMTFAADPVRKPHLDRVKVAQDLLAQAKKAALEGKPITYKKGCSAFVSAVLQATDKLTGYQTAEQLLGKDVRVGVDDNYQGLKQGDVVGWTEAQDTQSAPGHQSAHVAIFIGKVKGGYVFIDVPGKGKSPRMLIMGYGAQTVYRSSRF